MVGIVPSMNCFFLTQRGYLRARWEWKQLQFSGKEGFDHELHEANSPSRQGKGFPREFDCVPWDAGDDGVLFFLSVLIVDILNQWWGFHVVGIRAWKRSDWSSWCLHRQQRLIRMLASEVGRRVHILQGMSAHKVTRGTWHSEPWHESPSRQFYPYHGRSQISCFDITQMVFLPWENVNHVTTTSSVLVGLDVQC